VLRVFHTVNAVGLALFGIAAPAHAETTIPIETGTTHVRFSCSAGLIAVAGRFETVQGRVAFEDDARNPSAVQVTIGSKSLTTGCPMVDDQLKGSDFFDSARHPTIVFKSTSVRTTAGQPEITGLLTVKAVTRPVTLQLALVSESPYDPPSGLGREDAANARPAIRASTQIRRSEFGMAGFNPLISDECDIQIRMFPPQGMLME
jgi:polyisoprenoid-binding protein YceI